MEKKNVFRRNGGFLIGCLLAAGVSYFTADVVMTKDLTSLLRHEEETEEQQLSETDTSETLAPETSDGRTYETDPFTVTASGNVIKGVEPEVPQQKQTESGDTKENPEISPTGQADGGTDGAAGADSYESDGYSGDDGSYDGSYDGDSYSDDGGYSDGSYDQPIEIQDPGNGDYYYDDGSVSVYDESGSGDGSSSSTPDDVILWGISSRYISEEELYNYDLGQLRLIRNEIFALHGRIFESQDLMDYFSRKSWYVPTYSPEEFDADMFDYLNDYEEANLNVILNYEAALGGY